MHFISLTFYGKNSLKDTARKPRYVLFVYTINFSKMKQKCRTMIVYLTGMKIKFGLIS